MGSFAKLSPEEGLASLRRAMPELREFLTVDLSEADTRCKLIDRILVEVLGWSESSIGREVNVKTSGTYIDYLLSTSHPVFVVEAKRNGVLYKLPKSNSFRHYKIGGVLSLDKELQETIDQAREYASNTGVRLCCVTNGSQFIFFRPSNDYGIPFGEQKAVVFRGLDEVLSNFLDFWEMLSFESVSEGRASRAILATETSDAVSSRPSWFLPEKPHLKDKKRERNKLFSFTREVIRKAFQNLASEDASEEILEQCYVESARDSSYGASLRSMIHDRPISAEREVTVVEVSRRGAGEFQRKVESQLFTNAGAEVVLLLGTVGAGKTTFIQRFRKVIAREKINAQCIWAYVNFNRYTEGAQSLGDWVADQIFEQIELDYPEIEFGSYKMLKQAYHAEYERLKKGRLAPLFESSPGQFEVEFANELKVFESSRVTHVTKVLVAASRMSGRRPFLVFDNADQFAAKTQDEVFQVAHRIASDSKSSLIISLREESYWKNKDFGALSAFHSSIFAVQAPRLEQVISKRFKYAVDLLRDQVGDRPVPFGEKTLTSSEAVKVFDQLKRTILAQDRTFLDFLELLSPGEIRRPLEQLARFLYSGHTNIDALVDGVKKGRERPVGFHEFFSAIALGDNEFYREDRSDVVNIFQVEGVADASNLIRLAVLARLLNARGKRGSFGDGFVAIDELCTDLGEYGLERSTTDSALAFLNSRRLVETEMQIREGNCSGLFARSTTAADYYIRKLSKTFVYVDTVLRSTPFLDKVAFEKVKSYSEQIESLTESRSDRLRRIELRVERTLEFACYIESEASTFRPIRDGAPWFHSDVRSLLVGLRKDLKIDCQAALESARSIFG